MRTRDGSSPLPIFIVAAAALVLAAAVPARADALPAPTDALPAPGTGTLYWRSPGGLVPLPALAIDVDVRVTGVLVQGTLHQTFRNTAPVTIEAVYVFPLP